MIRTAAKTVAGFEEQDASLRELAAVALPIVQDIRGDYKPEGWDSLALCTNLTCALKGDLDFADFPGARDKVLKIGRDFKNGSFKGSLQKALYNAIVSCTKYEFDLTFRRRLKKWDIEPPLRIHKTPPSEACFGCSKGPPPPGPPYLPVDPCPLASPSGA